MSETWEKAALKIGGMICNASKRYPQLIPLHTSWMNFVRKHQVQQPDAGRYGSSCFATSFEAHGLLVIPTTEFDRLISTVKRQDEEIKALEYRITTLMRPEQ